MISVIAVIGLVAVSAFVIVFLADLLINVIDSKNGIFFKRKPEEKPQEDNTALLAELEDKPKLIEQNKQQESNVDFELAESERLALTQANQKMAMENEDLKQRISALQAKQEEDDDDDDSLTDEELDKMYESLIADINSEDDDEQDEQKDEQDLNLYDFDDDDEQQEQETEQPEQDQARLELEKQVEQLKQQLADQQQQSEQEKDQLTKQLEQNKLENQDKVLELTKQLEQEQLEKQNLTKQLEEKPQVIAETVEVIGGETLESLLAQKAQLEERLKDASRELKLNKKEYIPLARIKKTLENDEAKLRRREAIVAKKKIVLFGVTNYVVDPEKEKELSEDLDQLEALRLSVQHCEEVMTENKDRYPLLESANKILKTTVANIKSDIDVVDQKIAKLQGTTTSGDDATTSE